MPVARLGCSLPVAGGGLTVQWVLKRMVAVVGWGVAVE